jgi:hypothetical protein
MKGYCPMKQYNELFGKVGQRDTYLNVVGIDNMMTIIGAIFITYQFNIPFPLSIISLYVIGILIHMLFGVQTKTLSYLGIQC